jgi:hypothetical protein
MDNNTIKCIYLCTKDVEKLTGKSKAPCIRIIQAVRKHYNIKARFPVNVKQYADFYNIDLDLLLHSINQNHKLPKNDPIVAKNQISLFDVI